jgi:hypothetical protein
MQDQENRKSRWLWFIGLYVAGLVVTALLAYGLRLLILP